MNGEIIELTRFVQEPAWLPWAVQYFFLVGISVGAFFITLPEASRGRLESGAGTAALLAALVAGFAAPVALLADLHQPARFWHFYAYTNGTSWMGWGAFFLPVYVLLLAAYGWLALAPALAQRTAAPGWTGSVAGLLAATGRSHPKALRMVAWSTAAAASLVVVYTGAEMAVVRARELWNTPLLGVAYLGTGIAGGAALAICLTADATARNRLARWLGGALGLTAVVVAVWALLGLLGDPAGAALVRLATEYRPWAALAWGLGGVALPLGLALRVRAVRLAALMALGGAWLFRWEMFMSGQAVPKNATGFYHYSLPWGHEGLLGIAGTAGVVVLLALLLSALVRTPAKA